MLKADLYYDSSNARSSTQKKLQIFTSRIDKIVTDWLKAKGCRDITELGQYKFIKESLKVWYPTEPLESSTQARPQHEDIALEEPVHKKFCFNTDQDGSDLESSVDSRIDYDSPPISPLLLGDDIYAI